MKFQVPSSKFQRSSSFQALRGRLEFGTYLELGAWDLELFMFDGDELSGYQHGTFDRKTC